MEKRREWVSFDADSLLFILINYIFAYSGNNEKKNIT